jgi:protein TonB
VLHYRRNKEEAMKAVLAIGAILLLSPGRISPQTPAQVPKRIRVGGQVESRMLMHKVRPIYPKEAKKAGIEGTVRLEVLIGNDGKVQSTKLPRGEPVLANSALKAVSKWRYRPTLLNGQPVEVLTEVDVNFTLAAAP